MNKIFFYAAILLILLPWRTTMAQPTKTTTKSTPVKTTTAQKATVRARVLESNTLKPMVGAVAVINKGEFHAMVDEKGEFELKNLPKKDQLEISLTFLGYKEVKRMVNTNVANNTINLGIIKMYEMTKDIENVVVEGTAPIAIQKGDTTQYNAAAFKVNPDAYAEDLVKKMPGVTITEGKVEAQGEEVKKVYVDGKRVFGNDPMTALKSLPANIVQSIQMFDEMDEQSKFAGFSDGRKDKAFNIVTTKGIKGAGFASFEAGYGSDQDKKDRYGIGGNFGLFRENHNLMINANTNNINQQRFGSGDMFGGGGMGGSGMGGGRGSRGGVSGMQKMTTAGITYNGTWSPKIKADFSYMFDNTNNTTTRDVLRNYFETERVPAREYSSLSVNKSDNFNHRVSLGFEYEINPKNKVILRASTNIQDNKSISGQRAYNYQFEHLDKLTNTIVAADTINRNESLSDTKRTGNQSNASLLWMHRFDKEGRTFSIDLTGNYSDNISKSNQVGTTFLNRSTVLGTKPIVWDTTINDQYVDGNTLNYSYGGRATYTEPLGMYSRINLNYSYTYDYSQSDRLAYSDDGMTVLFDSLSNKFTNDVLTQSFGAGYTYSNGRSNFNAGVNYNINRQDKNQMLPKSMNLDPINFYSWAPSIDYSYYLEKSRYLNVIYNGNTTLPSVEQLQDVVDNTNTLMVSTGNPHLKQGYSHTLRVRYNVSNIQKSTNFFLGFSVQNSMNAIMNNTFTVQQDTTVNGYLVQKGVRFSQPINMDGGWSIRGMTGYSFRINPLKSNLNFDGSYRYSRQPSIYEKVKNISNSHDVGLGIGLVSNISENVDFDFNSRSTYSFADNTTKTDSRYFSETVRARVNIIFLKSFVFSSDINYVYNKNITTTSMSDDYALWNASIAKKFLKNRQAEIRISVNDILKQNTSYQHSINDTYIEDTRTNVMGRYVMVTFSYKFNSMDKFKGQMPSKGARGMRGPGGMGGMGGGFHRTH